MMKILIILIAVPVIAIAFLYLFYPAKLVAFAIRSLRKRGGMVQKSVRVDGRDWPYLEGGTPGGTPLVFVHGFGGDKDNWSMIAPHLKDRFHIIAPDLPGFGENSRDPELPYDIASQTARLKGFLDALGIARPHLAGNSMGGWIALRFAIDYPDALASLILLNNAGVIGAGESDLQKQAANEDYNPLILADIKDADRLMAMVVHRPRWIPARFKPVMFGESLKHKALLDQIFWVIATEGRDAPLNDRLDAVKVPTLILWGRHDRLIDVSCVAVLDAGIADSEAHIIEHVGHVPMVEDAKASAAIIRAFLAKH